MESITGNGLFSMLWLIPLGFIIGAFGTLIGAGGGFVLMPVLILLFPDESPEICTSISLAVVFFNTLSGSGAYARMRRIDYKSALFFSAATIPGAILGAFTTSHISRRLFYTIFGIFMIAAAVFLLLRQNGKREIKKNNPEYHLTRNLVETDGTTHTFSYNPIVGVGLSLFVGYVSSLLGIGGGIIHVPLLVHLLNFPVHIATATSHSILAVMSFTGTVVHITTGTFSHGIWPTIFLSIGVLIGAPLGARLSNRVRGDWIMRGLAVALGFVGIRILVMAL
ncbi:MAG: sulfite exporter TauE/SafE family protein [Deltaproteobacteria bacterium CG_4_8_14_3_um_filter_45_9]|nr:MAG: sulfite exporter TauE/SafE family protein [Deltaproteobacteria bacterium CG03_land_8_20_14_0_80_45_14]PIX26092.1 MAG: sulfite exporter TauE/SafE family protein [Deltaproteobacteria bacterium CG_4_8_14_3_um_filter_45_9]